MPTVNDMTFQFAGAAGTGCDSQGSGWARSLTRASLWTFAYFDFESRIRGGHIFYQIRVGEQPVESHSLGIHVLLAFDAEAIRERIDDVLPGGAVIFDENYDLTTPSSKAATCWSSARRWWNLPTKSTAIA